MTALSGGRVYESKVEQGEPGTGEWVRVPVGARQVLVAVNAFGSASVETTIALNDELSAVPFDAVIEWEAGPVSGKKSGIVAPVAALRLVCISGSAVMRVRVIL